MSNENSLTSIYVIGPEGGPYKIGYAQDPKARLSNLQVGQAVELKLHYEEATETATAKVIEKLIHKQIAHKRVRGEWFDVSLEEAIGEVRFAFIRWEDEPNLTFRYKRKLL
jgi:hypothetical protein